MRIFSDLQA